MRPSSENEREGRGERGVPKNFYGGLAEGENVLDATPMNACGNHGVKLRDEFCEKMTRQLTRVIRGKANS